MTTRGASTTPSDDAFYFPADTCRHARLWLPWPAESAPRLRDAIAHLAHVIAEFEPIALAVTPGDEISAENACGSAVETIALPHTSLRLRDTGPTFLVNGKGGAAAVDWRFNGWGERGANPNDDEILAHALLGLAEVRRFRAPLTLEPGAFVSDGRDTVLALAPAVFDTARNPGLARLDAFAIFQQWLGAARVIWLDEPHPADKLAGDIRALAAFAGRGLVVASKVDADHPFALPLARAASALAKARDAQGKNLEVITIPAPPPAGNAPLSYTTFLPINGALIMPAFDAAADNEAAAVLARLFPGRAVRPVPAMVFAEAGLTLASLAVPHPARLLERDRATVLPRSAWSQPAPDVDAMLQKYIDLAERE